MFQSPTLIHLRLLQPLKDKSIMSIKAKPAYNSVLVFGYAGSTFVRRSAWQMLSPLFFNYHYTKVCACTDYSAVGILIIFNEIKQDFSDSCFESKTVENASVQSRTAVFSDVWSASQGSESHVMLWVIFWVCLFSFLLRDLG